MVEGIFYNEISFDIVSNMAYSNIWRYLSQLIISVTTHLLVAFKQWKGFDCFLLFPKKWNVMDIFTL